MSREWWFIAVMSRCLLISARWPTDKRTIELGAIQLAASARVVQSKIRSQTSTVVRIVGPHEKASRSLMDKATVLPNEASIAACSVYVYLNLIRARVAATPEERFHECSERIAGRKAADEVSTAEARDVRIAHGQKAGWLAPVGLEPKRRKVREKCSSRRASNKGCAFMSLPCLNELLSPSLFWIVVVLDGPCELRCRGCGESA